MMVQMISHSLLLRSYTRDRLFLVLLGLSFFSGLIALVSRHAEYERSALPFELGIIFFLVNTSFAIVSLRREPLLAYMLLTASILINGTLLFYFRYLNLIQAG